MSRASRMGAFCVLFFVGCSSGPAATNGGDAGGGGGGGSSGSSSGAGAGSSGASSGGSSSGSGGGSSSGSGGGTLGAQSLIGTWDLILGPAGTSGLPTTTVTIGQDSLTVTSPDFVLTATRTGNTVTYADQPEPNSPSSIDLTAGQTVATFNAGILPFNLGGSWAMQIARPGQAAVMTCTLSVSSTEIDGACNKITDGFSFTFTTAKMSSAASVLGDFGGKWMNTWVWPGTSGGTYPCELDFIGSGITTCQGGGPSSQTPVAGITFTYDGANTASGAAMGWAEYSATRR